jgi:hypothetical protein
MSRRSGRMLERGLVDAPRGCDRSHRSARRAIVGGTEGSIVLSALTDR